MITQFYKWCFLRLSVADGDGGPADPPAAPPGLHELLPEDLRDNPSLKDVRTVGDLAKGFVHAQSLVGKRGLPEPSPDWKPEEWDGFYNKLGRPDKPDGYKLSEDFKPPEGVQLDEAKMGKMKDMLHKHGITSRQFEGIVSDYLNVSAEEMKEMQTMQELSVNEGLDNLRKELGRDYGPTVDAANLVIEKFGGEAVAEFFQKNPTLSNSPEIIRFLAEVGKQFADDSSMVPGLGNSSGRTGKASEAKHQMDSYMNDADFKKALYDSAHPQHDWAVSKRVELQKVISQSNKK